MEDWQGCLSPLCQTALQAARDSVMGRGGYAVTVEDFILAMLDHVPELRQFLGRQGVDLDELTRTVQCEQPIITEVGGENLLSSQLLYWFYATRELSSKPWLDWPILFSALTLSAERLQDKAYVAVLEQVRFWPTDHGDDLAASSNDGSDHVQSPVVLADKRWLGLIEEMTVELSSSARSLLWLKGSSGSGKSSLLRPLITTLPGGALEVDIRREAEVLASSQSALPSEAPADQLLPTLVLDNVSPADLVSMMAQEFSVARELVTAYPGPILLLSADSSAAQSAIEPLQQQTGRSLRVFPMVKASVGQRMSVLTVHQPFIEKRWRIEFSPSLVDFASRQQHPLTASPGGMLRWVERAAARLSLFADRGPLESIALAGRADALRRQSLVAIGRGQPTDRLEYSLEALSVERAAIEVAWHERKRNGSLQMLGVEDLRYELEQWVAAGRESGQTIDQYESGWEQELA